MKRLLVLACLLITFNCSQAQTAEALVRDVLANMATTSQLKSVLQKNAPYNDDNASHYFGNDMAFLGQSLISAGFRYITPLSGDENIHKMVTLRAIHKGEKLGYICISAKIFNLSHTVDKDTILLKYIDTTNTASMLTPYNAKHQTNFTWHDLYEDSLKIYDDLNELLEPGLGRILTIEDDSAYRLPYSTSIFKPMLINRDHAAIVTNARSFNPVRKAYGGYCLFILETIGEKLSTEEKQLFNTISRSKEIITVRRGCLVKTIPISSRFTKQELESFVWVFKRFKSRGGQF